MKGILFLLFVLFASNGFSSQPRPQVLSSVHFSHLCSEKASSVERSEMAQDWQYRSDFGSFIPNALVCDVDKNSGKLAPVWKQPKGIIPLTRIENTIIKCHSERAQRLEATRKLMKKKNYEALLTTDPSMLLYFTNVALNGALVITHHRAFLFVYELYRYQIAPLKGQFHVQLVPLDYDVGTAFAAALPHFQGQLAIWPSNTVQETIESLKHLFKKDQHRHLIGDDELFQTIRRRKQESELQNIKRSCEIAQGSMELAISLCKKGISEKELSAKIQTYMLDAGAGVAFEPIVAFGLNSLIPHWSPSDTRLNDQSFVLIDCGAVWNSYRSDMTRVIFLKPPSKELYSLFRTVKKAYLASIKKARAGVKCTNLIDITTRIFKKENIEQFALSGIGHGVGLDIHEPPFLEPWSTERLIEHDVIAVEPGVYIPQVGGLRVEDTYMVQKKKVISFMTLPLYIQVTP